MGTISGFPRGKEQKEIEKNFPFYKVSYKLKHSLYSPYILARSLADRTIGVVETERSCSHCCISGNQFQQYVFLSTYPKLRTLKKVRFLKYF